MGAQHTWIVVSPSISNDFDGNHSDSVSIISESDQDASNASSKYFWDNTHISLSGENIAEENITPDTRNEQMVPEISDYMEETFEEKETFSLWPQIKQLSKPSLWISILLVTNLCIYSYFDLEHSVVLDKLQVSENHHKDLRLEINTLRKIIFLMNVDENVPASPRIDSFERGEETRNWEDAKIYTDETNRKFICVDVKKFIDIL